MQTPKVFRQPKMPKGGGYHPLEYFPSRAIFSRYYVSVYYWILESNGKIKVEHLHELSYFRW
jgi:hypothetical protein